MIRRLAAKHGRYFFYVNQVGGNDELVFDGHSIGVRSAAANWSCARATSTRTCVVYDVPIGPAPRQAATPILRDVSTSR